MNTKIKQFQTGFYFAIGALAASITVGIFAVAVDTMTTFTTGTAAKASEVNANFTALKTAVESIPSWAKGTTATNAVYTAGNVGIGTTAPSTRFELHQGKNNTSPYGLRIGNQHITANTQYYHDIYSEHNDLIIHAKGDAVTNGGTGNIRLNVTNGTTTTTGMFINNNGSIGIGTTSLDGKFTIRNQSDATSRILFRLDDYNSSASGGTNLFIQGNGTSSRELTIANSWSKLHLGASAAGSITQKLSIDTSGNVGIGTTSPTTLLHISNATSSSIRLAETTSSTDSYIIHDSTGLNLSMVHGLPIIFKTFNSERMRILSDGKVGIGSSNPSVALHVVGAACSTGGGGLTACASDKRLKENVEPIKNALSTILQLNPVSFTWNKISEKEFGYKTGQKDIGVIAQEIEKINPEWVRTTQGDYKAVNDTFVKWYSVKAIQELKLENDRLSSKYASLLDDQKKVSDENAKLREEIATLRATVETHGRASLRLDERLKAIETLQMAKK